ncbi:glycine betaine ABC transporter substrate-binding protein [Desulfocicer vacuolatum]|nr:glycine betaine ABC transporter substrate-binding protein [Desulfocicer vacuolatum]
MILLTLCVAVIVSYEQLSGPDIPSTVIHIHDDQIDIQKFNNEIAVFIIEKGYGYPVEKVESTIKEVHSKIMDGDIDITLEMWRENNIVWYEKAIASGRVVDLGTLYATGHQFWIIPEWFARENSIETVFDMKHQWRKLLDPEDPSKGLFFNCIFGWTCRDINRVKLKAYGLDRFFNTVSPSSPEALRAIYENAMEMHIPVFGYYWRPNALMATHKWYILKEPPYDSAIWYNINQASGVNGPLSIDTACAYGNNSVLKIAHKQLIEKAPDIAKMFRKMSVNIEHLEEILFLSNKNQPNFKAAARTFLLKHGSSWHGWVTPEARKKISLALDDPLMD